MTRRLYADTANSYSILSAAVLQGLGANNILPPWPRGRSYSDIATFRGPYVSGMYQPGARPLLGLGDVPSAVAASAAQSAPPDVKRFLISGEPVPKLVNNVSLPFNQVPRMGYGVIALAALGLSYFSYKRFKKTKGQGAAGG